MERFLTVADVARILSLTPAGVRLLHQRGRLKLAAETEGGIRLFRREDVDRLASERAGKRRTPLAR